MQDPEEQRAGIREEWEAAAPRWERRRAWFQRAADPVSRWLVDAVDPQPGQTVLEAACGLGDTGLLAAERTGPDGHVILADGAEAMVEAARRRAEELGRPGVEATRMELEWLDRETASVDGMLVRFGYMLVVDPEAGLREARRVLRPGGRLALAVWADRERNPWMDAVRRAFERRGLIDAPAAGAPHMFSLADADELTELVLGAGFLEVRTEEVPIAFRSADVTAHRDALLDTSTSMRAAVDARSPAERDDLLAEVDADVGAAATAGDDGDVVLAGTVLALVATA